MYLATKPPKRCTASATQLLVARNDFAQVLRVHAGGEGRRADKVREHHCDLAAFGGVLGFRLGHDLRGGRSSACKLGNRRLHFPPVTQRNAKLFEVLIGQVTEDRGIDVARGKALRVLGHAELFEPVPDLLHCGAAFSLTFGRTYPIEGL